ncbi:ribosome-inactivating family protein [Streptomyces cellostaticus]|uniref:ribosome-inactivating family protein n=1 Tax=Streptomyces TaxID=1883 RepID=UPI002026765B|nr:ribosome-inactivating family protein [Streptomyces cellostaticus]
MSTPLAPRRASRTAALALAAVCLLGASGSLTPAAADTPYRQVTHVYMNLGDTASPSQQSQYGALINSLRQAAGHPFRDGTGVTQTTGRALIRMTLTVPVGNERRELTLWFTPGDLYLRGFTASNGLTWQFNDADFNLRTLMDDLGQLPPGTGRTLGMGSNYNSLSGRAGRGREAMPMGYADFLGSVRNLAQYTGGGNQQDIARSLMFMIQVTSEAARFNDVFGIGSAITRSGGTTYHGLPPLQQFLENSWNRISEYGYAVSHDPGTAPASINGVGTLRSWRDVARYLALMLGSLTLPQEGPKGDWNHTEL